jgi:hypothetical protein
MGEVKNSDFHDYCYFFPQQQKLWGLQP